jgi:hypothetical protein
MKKSAVRAADSRLMFGGNVGTSLYSFIRNEKARRARR